MTTGYVALYSLAGDGLGIASAATDVSLANRNLALGTGSLTATNLTGTLQTAAQPNVTTLAGVTSMSASASGVGIGTTASATSFLTVSKGLTASSGTITGTSIACALGGVGGTVDEASQLYITPTHTNNVNTTTAVYGIHVLPGSSTGSITRAYGARFERPAIGTSKYSAVFDHAVGIGTTTPAAGSIFDITGTWSDIGSNVQYGMTITPNLSRSGSINDVRAISLVPTFTTSGGNIISSAYGLYAGLSLSGGVGDIGVAYGIYVSPGSGTNIASTSYGLYVSDPTNGQTNRCAYFGGNVAIGSTTAANNRLEVIGGGLRVQGAASITGTGAGIELEYTGGTGYLTAYNRAASAWLPLQIRVSNLTLMTGGTARAIVDASGHFVPGTHNTYDLGTTALRWRDAWVQRGAFNGSDERVKTQIQPTRFGLDFVRKLKPVSWQWKDTSGDDTALHHGFIAQQVKQVLTELGATNQDFGGYHDPEDRKQTGFLALAYNEFISPVVAAIQELDRRYPEPAPDDKVAPLTATSPGRRGEFRSTDQHLFVCVADNRWVRTPIETQF